MIGTVRYSAFSEPLQARALAAIFVAAVILRLGNLLLIECVELMAFIEDSSLYWSGAQAWLDSGYFSVRKETGFIPETERVPLYFLFLMAFHWAFEAPLWPVLLSQILIDAGSCVVIALIGGLLSRRVALAAGLFAIVWPNFIIHSSLILTESLFIFLLSLCLYFCARFLADGRLRTALLAALFCGAALATRPVVQFLPFAMAFAAPFVVRRHGGKNLLAASAGILVLVVSFAPSMPLIMRNLNLYESPALTAQSGTHLLYWITSRTISMRDGRPFEEVTRDLNLKLEARAAEQGVDIDNQNPFALSRMRTELAIEELSALPASLLARAWIQGAFVNLFAPAVSVDPRLRRMNKASFYNTAGNGLFDRVKVFISRNDSVYAGWTIAGILSSALGSLLALYGFYRLFKVRPWAAIFAALFVLYFLLVTGPVTSPKYRIPMEPILVLLQAIAVVCLAERFRRRDEG